MAFTVGRFKFIDSYNFLKYSLDKLAGLLSDDELVITRQDTVPEDIPLLRKKGVYLFRTDDQFVPLINGTPVDQPGTRLINRVPGYSTGYPVAL